MAAKKQPRPDLSEDVRQERQAEVYRLHCRGLTHRAIAAEMSLDCAQVQRALNAARAVIRRRKGEQALVDLAARLTDGAWEDLADSWRVAERAEAETVWLDPKDEDATRVEVPAPDWKTVNFERANRVKLRELIIRANGLDPNKVAELELKRQELELKKRQAAAQERFAAAGEDLLRRWSAWGTEPGNPDAV